MFKHKCNIARVTVYIRKAYHADESVIYARLYISLIVICYE